MRCFLAEPVIEDCRFEKNSSEDEGGGMFCDWSSPSIRRCVIRGNEALFGAGVSAFWESNLELVDCLIVENLAAADGGGVACSYESDGLLRRVVLRDNQAARGGAASSHRASPRFEHCEVVGNSAHTGGGIHAETGRLLVADSYLADNAADASGGAISVAEVYGYWWGGLVLDASMLVGNRAGGSGGAVCGASGVTLDIDHCTMTGNEAGSEGGAVYCGQSLAIKSSIVRYNGTDAIAGYQPYGEVLVSYSNIQGGWLGEGNIDLYPLFCDAGCGAINDLSLAADSPCVGTGEGGSNMGSYGVGCDTPVRMGTIRVPSDVAEIGAAAALLCDGDTLLIEPGTYREWGIELPPREIVVTGSAPEDSIAVAATVVDGDRQGVVLAMELESDRPRRIQGITITGGRGADGGGIVCRGGAETMIEWCAIVDNESHGSGAGLLIEGTDTFVSHCVFADNRAQMDGGGAWIDGRKAEIALSDCVFVRNSCGGGGGGLFVGPAASRLSAGSGVFVGNEAVGAGGGLLAESYADLEGCLLLSNRSSNGGGLYRRGGSLERCDIRDNISSGPGGGTGGWPSDFIYCVIRNNQAAEAGGGIYASRIDMVGCLIVENSANQGGGMRIRISESEIVNSTIAENRAWNGGGMLLDGTYSGDMNNCIVWGNSGDQITPGTSINVSYSSIEGGWRGTGNLDAHPRFFSRQGFDYLLGPESPAVDAGDPEIEDQIYDAHPRWPVQVPNGVRSDMGAYGGPENRAWYVRRMGGEEGS